MQNLEIYLKSGHTIKVECEGWVFNYDKEACEYTGYTFNGIRKPSKLGIVPSQIAGYIVK